MKFQVEKGLLKNQLEKFALIEVLFGIFFYLSQIQIGIESESFATIVIRLIITAPLAYLYYRLRNMFYYSLWTFNGILFFYILFDMFNSFLDGMPYSFILSGFSLFLLITLSWMLLNPIYFPLISWWEYDFRNIKDLKIKIESNEKNLDARVCDLKNEFGSIACFDELDLGKNYNVKGKIKGDEFNLAITVLSKRLYSLGRPRYYGVRIDQSSISNNLLRSSIKRIRNDKNK